MMFIAALVMASGLWGQQTEKLLTLEECILSAVKNNLDVAVQILNPQISDTAVAIANQKFLPQLSFNFNTRSTNQASFSWIQSAGAVSTESRDYYAQIQQAIPTGGNFTIQLYSQKTDSNQKYQTINPYYYSQLTFDFNQPLLKNFGFKYSRREILIAKTNRDISESQFKNSLLLTVYNVESAYWNLVYYIENLKVQRQALLLAQNLLKKNKREVDVGTLAPIEILTAEAEVAIREADILQAEVLVRNAEDNLKTIINKYSPREGAALKIVPGDEPIFEKREVSLEEALATAMANRPDLETYRLDIKNKELDFGYAKNQLLPELNLQASYWSPGLSGTQLLYRDGNPLTDEIVGTVPGGVNKSFEDALNFKYKNWSVGLVLTFPINTVFSRAQYAQAKLSLQQSMKSLQSQEQRIFLEIRNAVRLVQTNYKRVQAYKAARELSDKKLEAEEKKLLVGLTTNYVVLQNQRDLANAHSAELRAIIDYNLSLAALDRALGTSLKKKNIQLMALCRLT